MKLLKSDVLMAVRLAVMLEIPSMAIRCGRYSHIVGAGNPSLAALFGGMKHEKETARDGWNHTRCSLLC